MDRNDSSASGGGGQRISPTRTANSLLSKLARRAILPVIIAIAIAVYFLGSGKGTNQYVTAPITRGPIIRSVIATGTVNPVTVVQVGTYVSGPIQRIYADFNTPVKAGQLIASGRVRKSPTH
jgi:multidrug efflux pump subunit AcrA (membrane-fusion protein)